MERQTYYTILGIDNSASKEEIIAAFNNRIHECNPTFECSEAQIETMLAIANAYKVLSDPSKKYSYDLMLLAIEKLKKEKENDYQKEYVKK